MKMSYHTFSMLLACVTGGIVRVRAVEFMLAAGARSRGFAAVARISTAKTTSYTRYYASCFAAIYFSTPVVCDL